MNKLLKSLSVLLPLFFASIACADPAGYLDLQTSTTLVAVDGDLNLGCSSTGVINFLDGQDPIAKMSSGQLVAPTADGADTGNMCLAGGGACDATRGAYIVAYGNEHATVPDTLDLVCGENGTIRAVGALRVQPGGDTNRRFTFDADSDTTHVMTFGDGTTANQYLHIKGSTADGADDGVLALTGAGGPSGSRGGYVYIRGNDYGGAGLDGGIYLQPGDGAAGQVHALAPSYGSDRKLRAYTAVSTALSGATYTFTNLIPAKSTYLGCVARVTTLITGATSFNIGDGTDADRWGAAVALAATTTTTQANFTATPYGWSATAISPVLTAVGSNFTAGVVRLTCFVEEYSGPTS